MINPVKAAASLLLLFSTLSCGGEEIFAFDGYLTALETEMSTFESVAAAHHQNVESASNMADVTAAEDNLYTAMTASLDHMAHVSDDMHACDHDGAVAESGIGTDIAQLRSQLSAHDSDMALATDVADARQREATWQSGLAVTVAEMRDHRLALGRSTDGHRCANMHDNSTMNH